MNATRALTTRHNAQLSCGRVQTPTLAMIAAREEEIKKFQPKTFYGITAMAEPTLKLVCRMERQMISGLLIKIKRKKYWLV